MGSVYSPLLMVGLSDGVGKATWEGSLKSVARRGLLVLFGNASGPVPLFDPLLLSKQVLERSNSDVSLAGWSVLGHR